MKKVLWLIVCLMTMIMSANAQNIVVDAFKTDKPFKSLYDHLILDPTKSIGENYAKIDSLMSLHKEKNLAEYTIMVGGHYTSIRGNYTDECVGMIEVKGEDNEYYRTISSQIINALTELYSKSLDICFSVKCGEYYILSVNKKRIKVETGRTFKRSDGKITKEYVEKEIDCNTLYCLYPSSPLYKKIYNKVIEETGLKDGGRLYDIEHLSDEVASKVTSVTAKDNTVVVDNTDTNNPKVGILEQKRNNITKTLKKVEEIRFNTKNNTPKNNRRSNMGDDMYF